MITVARKARLKTSGIVVVKTATRTVEIGVSTVQDRSRPYEPRTSYDVMCYLLNVTQVKAQELENLPSLLFESKLRQRGAAKKRAVAEGTRSTFCLLHHPS